jgi:hypothetical protein
VVEYDDGLPDGVIDSTTLPDWSAVMRLARDRGVRHVFVSDDVDAELPNAQRDCSIAILASR